MNLNVLFLYMGFCKARNFVPTFTGLKNYNKYVR